MIRSLCSALLILGALSACAPIPVGGRVAPPKPAVGPEIIVRIPQRGQAARDLVERVGARCWLDGVTRGHQMIVDRQTGRIVIVDETKDLLAADFLQPKDGRSRIRISGPVIADPVKRGKIVASLDKAARGGDTSCPIAAG